LTFDKAFALAQSIELEERDAKNLKNMPLSPPQPSVIFSSKAKANRHPLPLVHTAKREREFTKKVECYCCERDHLAPAAP